MRHLTTYASKICAAMLLLLASLTAFFHSQSAQAATRVAPKPAPLRAALRTLFTSRLQTMTYVVRPGDTLSLIAYKLWGSASYWPKLWYQNRAEVPNPDLIEIGQKLTVHQDVIQTKEMVSLAFAALPQPRVVTTTDLTDPPKAGPPAHTRHIQVAADPAPAGGLQGYAQQLLDEHGLGGQWGCFDSVEMREAGWNIYATNPQSGAYGLPQALPPGKMAEAGPDWQTDGYTQLRWMIDDYIIPVYGTPCNAWGHEEADGWY